jgi:hypothetical protein
VVSQTLITHFLLGHFILALRNFKAAPTFFWLHNQFQRAIAITTPKTHVNIVIVSHEVKYSHIQII